MDPDKTERVTTTLRLPADWLEALKILAAKERRRVNDLVLEGVAHVLVSKGQPPKQRKLRGGQ